MIIVRGVNVFPSQIESALLAAEGVLPHYQIVLTRRKGLDCLAVRVEVTPAMFDDKVGALEGLQAALSRAIENVLTIRADVELVAPHTLPRSEGKARRVIDQRADAD